MAEVQYLGINPSPQLTPEFFRNRDDLTYLCAEHLAKSSNYEVKTQKYFQTKTNHIHGTILTAEQDRLHTGLWNRLFPVGIKNLFLGRSSTVAVC